MSRSTTPQPVTVTGVGSVALPTVDTDKEITIKIQKALAVTLLYKKLFKEDCYLNNFWQLISILYKQRPNY